MTDITELAQSLKAAAIDAKELAIIARYSKGRAAAEKFYALANPNNVLALVEALEKARQRITQMESRTVTVKLPNQTQFDDPLSAYEAIEKCKEALTAEGIKWEAE